MPPFRRLPLTIYNGLHKRIWPVSRPTSSSPELREIEEWVARVPGDISDHLATIFSEAVAVQPRLKVSVTGRGIPVLLSAMATRWLRLAAPTVSAFTIVASSPKATEVGGTLLL